MINLFKLIKEKIMKILKKDILTIESKESEIVINNKDEKKDFFVLYKNVKNGRIKKEQLLITDLIKIQLMMEKEKEFYDEQIKLEEKEIMELDTQINKLKIDNKN